MFLLNLLGGKLKTADESSMLAEPENHVFSESMKTEEVDPFGDYTTVVHFEDGTNRFYNYRYVDTNVAVGLLNVHTDYRVYFSYPVEMKYYMSQPDYKIYLLKNRVMRKENRGLQKRFNIREKGPAVVFRLVEKPKPILPSSPVCESTTTP